MAPQFNEADFAVLVSCLKNSSTKLTPDFDTVAQECGLKDGKAAYFRHWAMMKKLGLTGTRTQPRKANKEAAATATRKRAAPSEEAEEGDANGGTSDGKVADDVEAPAKKAKKSA